MILLRRGEVASMGTPREIINDPEVRSAYLGNTFRGDEFDTPHPQDAKRRPGEEEYTRGRMEFEEGNLPEAMKSFKRT